MKIFTVYTNPESGKVLAFTDANPKDQQAEAYTHADAALKLINQLCAKHGTIALQGIEEVDGI